MSTPASSRRQFLGQVAGILGGLSCTVLPHDARAEVRVGRVAGVKLKLALNSYSFNEPLRAGRMTLEDVVRFCAEHGVDALDATGYYFPGYPSPPPDEFVHRLKRFGLVNGVAICGTGVRNDFTVPDPAVRQRDVQLVRNWIDVAARLGAPVIRIFAGAALPAGQSFEEILPRVAAEVRECANYGRQRGVVVAIQNHHDFLKTAEDTRRLLAAVDSEWCGLILDIGSLRAGDPYAEIEQLIPSAVSWQIKDTVWSGKTAMPVDLKRLRRLIDAAGYRGFLPIETLGANNTPEKVAAFVARVKSEMAI